MEKDFDTSPFALLLMENQHLLVGDIYFTGYFSTKYLYNCFRVACQGAQWHKNASKSTNLDHMHTTLMIYFPFIILKCFPMPGKQLEKSFQCWKIMLSRSVNYMLFYLVEYFVQLRTEIVGKHFRNRYFIFRTIFYEISGIYEWKSSPGIYWKFS